MSFGDIDAFKTNVIKYAWYVRVRKKTKFNKGAERTIRIEAESIDAMKLLIPDDAIFIQVIDVEEI